MLQIQHQHIQAAFPWKLHPIIQTHIRSALGIVWGSAYRLIFVSYQNAHWTRRDLLEEFDVIRRHIGKNSTHTLTLTLILIDSWTDKPKIRKRRESNRSNCAWVFVLIFAAFRTTSLFIDSSQSLPCRWHVQQPRCSQLTQTKHRLCSSLSRIAFSVGLGIRSKSLLLAAAIIDFYAFDMEDESKFSSTTRKQHRYPIWEMPFDKDFVSKQTDTSTCWRPKVMFWSCRFSMWIWKKFSNSKSIQILSKVIWTLLYSSRQSSSHR